MQEQEKTYASPFSGRFFEWYKIVALAIVLSSLEFIYRYASGGIPNIITITVDTVLAIILTIYLVWLVSGINVRSLHIALLLSVNIFVVRYFSNMIEGYFFTTVFQDSETVFGALLFSAIFSIMAGFSTGYILVRKGRDESLLARMKSYFSHRSTSKWLLRIAVASLIYYPIYFAFGAIVSPFVIPYYSDPSLGLRIPPFSTIVLLEFLRGFIYVMALIPLIAATNWNRRFVFIAISMMLFIPGALIPLAQSPLPFGILPFHTTEIFADSIVYGIALTYILGLPKRGN